MSVAGTTPVSAGNLGSSGLHQGRCDKIWTKKGVSRMYCYQKPYWAFFRTLLNVEWRAVFACEFCLSRCSSLGCRLLGRRI